MVIKKVDSSLKDGSELVDGPTAVKYMCGKVVQDLLILIHPHQMSARQTADSPRQKKTEQPEGNNSEGSWHREHTGWLPNAFAERMSMTVGSF